MNLLELRYFTAVSRHQSIHRAAKEMRISPAAVSKAIGRLESELGVPLLAREGGKIRSTEAGVLLARRATALIQLEEATRIEVMGPRGRLHATLAGPEVLLVLYRSAITNRLRADYPDAQFEVSSTTEANALNQVASGNVHVGVVACPVPTGFSAARLGEVRCRVAVGPNHPLFPPAMARRPVALGEVLAHPFACPTLPFIGQVSTDRSLDGWLEDLAPRRIAYRSTCLKMVEELVRSGEVLAYMPEGHIRAFGAEIVEIRDLPFECRFDVHATARTSPPVRWIEDLLASLETPRPLAKR